MLKGVKESRYSIRIAAERELVAIDDFRLSWASINVLLGESGIGKSLIALALSGLLDPRDLDVRIDGRPYRTYLQSTVAANIRANGFFVFQEPSTHLNPLLTLRAQLNEGSLENGMEEATILGKLWHGKSASEVQRILDVYPKPHRPSGGEKQRILAAMAFKKISNVNSETPGALFVFDEPTGNLDNPLRDEFLDLLVEKFSEKRVTVLLITHDYSMIGRLAKAYPDIAGRIFYRELHLERDRLQLKDFLAKEYLSWLESRKKPEPVQTKGEPLVVFESGARIFGRSLLVSRDPDGKDPTPFLVHRGNMTYLKGPSGAGKTTVLKLMMGLLAADKMRMRIRGTAYSEGTPRSVWQGKVWGRQMTLVFQHADEALNQNSKVRGVFDGLPLPTSHNEGMIVRTLAELFEDEEYDEFLQRSVKHLSGGQKQRLNLLRSMILDSDILLLDEPLNGLDFNTSVKVISKVEDKLRAGKGVVVISHNEEIFDRFVSSENTYYLRPSISS